MYSSDGKCIVVMGKCIVLMGIEKQNTEIDKSNNYPKLVINIQTRRGSTELYVLLQGQNESGEK